MTSLIETIITSVGTIITVNQTAPALTRCWRLTPTNQTVSTLKVGYRTCRSFGSGTVKARRHFGRRRSFGATISGTMSWKLSVPSLSARFSNFEGLATQPPRFGPKLRYFARGRNHIHPDSPLGVPRPPEKHGWMLLEVGCTTQGERIVCSRSRWSTTTPERSLNSASPMARSNSSSGPRSAYRFWGPPRRLISVLQTPSFGTRLSWKRGWMVNHTR